MIRIVYGMHDIVVSEFVDEKSYLEFLGSSDTVGIDIYSYPNSFYTISIQIGPDKSTTRRVGIAARREHDLHLLMRPKSGLLIVACGNKVVIFEVFESTRAVVEIPTLISDIVDVLGEDRFLVIDETGALMLTTDGLIKWMHIQDLVTSWCLDDGLLRLLDDGHVLLHLRDGSIVDRAV